MANENDQNNGNQAKVAYDMALNMWHASDRGGPNVENKAEFLDLVHECYRALTYRGRTVSKSSAEVI